MSILTRIRRNMATGVAFALAVFLVVALVLTVSTVSLIWFAAAGLLVLILWTSLPLAIIVGAATVPVVTADAYVIRHVRRRGGVPYDAHLLPDDTDHPLRTLLDDLARDMNTAPPKYIWVTPRPVVFVHEARSLFHAPHRTRHLCIGTPVVDALTVGQLRAVFSHELAHYAQRHATFATMVHRGSSVLAGIRSELARTELPQSDSAVVDRLMHASASLQRRIFAFYALLYDLLTLAVRRRHERAADRIAATTVGGKPLAEALKRIDGLSPPSAEKPAATSRWRDSHPPLQSRLAAVTHHQNASAPAPGTDHTPAAQLLLERFPDPAASQKAAEVPGRHGTPEQTGINPISVLFIIWGTLLGPAALLSSLLGYPDRWPMIAGTIAFLVLLPLVAFRQPRDWKPPAAPRKLRKWIYPTSALMLSLICVMHVVRVGPVGLGSVAIILCVGYPFLRLRRPIRAWRGLLALGLGASMLSLTQTGPAVPEGVGQGDDNSTPETRLELALGTLPPSAGKEREGITYLHVPTARKAFTANPKLFRAPVYRHFNIPELAELGYGGDRESWGFSDKDVEASVSLGGAGTILIGEFQEDAAVRSLKGQGYRPDGIDGGTRLVDPDDGARYEISPERRIYDAYPEPPRLALNTPAKTLANDPAYREVARCLGDVYMAMYVLRKDVTHDNILVAVGAKLRPDGTATETVCSLSRSEKAAEKTVARLQRTTEHGARYEGAQIDRDAEMVSMTWENQPKTGLYPRDYGQDFYLLKNFYPWMPGGEAKD